jgi:hypothetical protein
LLHHFPYATHMKRSALWNSPAFAMSAATLLLGVNFWGLGPWIGAHYGEVAGNITYIALRLLVFIGLPAAVISRSETPRFRAVTALAAVAFTDQVLFKILFFHLDHQSHPEAWGSVDLRTFAMVTLNSFILFCPIILVFGGLGALLGQKIGRIAQGTP